MSAKPKHGARKTSGSRKQRALAPEGNIPDEVDEHAPTA